MACTQSVAGSEVAEVAVEVQRHAGMQVVCSGMQVAHRWSEALYQCHARGISQNQAGTTCMLCNATCAALLLIPPLACYPMPQAYRCTPAASHGRPEFIGLLLAILFTTNQNSRPTFP